MDSYPGVYHYSSSVSSTDEIITLNASYASTLTYYSTDFLPIDLSYLSSCATLVYITVDAVFDPLNSPAALANDLYVQFTPPVSPAFAIFKIGYTFSWPDSWTDPASGVYHAEFDLSLESTLVAQGVWTYSFAQINTEAEYYEVTVTTKYLNPQSCPSVPTAAPTETALYPPTFSPTPALVLKTPPGRRIDIEILMTTLGAALLNNTWTHSSVVSEISASGNPLLFLICNT